MGASPDEPEKLRGGEKQHLVRLTRPFLIGSTEVTQGQWKAVMKSSPWKGQRMAPDGDGIAANYVGWKDAVAFCEALSAMESRKYRLPTESEWEYACRAGTKTTFWSGNDTSGLADAAWIRENAKDLPHEVGQKRPNPWGLFDMHSNLWEWCSDWYGDSSAEAAVDPQGPASGSEHVLRGGGFWSLNYADHRSATRRASPEIAGPEYGFRVVMEESR